MLPIRDMEHRIPALSVTWRRCNILAHIRLRTFEDNSAIPCKLYRRPDHRVHFCGDTSRRSERRLFRDRLPDSAYHACGGAALDACLGRDFCSNHWQRGVWRQRDEHS